MAVELEQSLEYLRLIEKLVGAKDPKLYLHLKSLCDNLIFALPWVLTWFMHNLNQKDKAFRAMDLLLIADKHFPVYMATALILMEKNAIESLQDVGQLHSHFQSFDYDFFYEEIVEKALELYALYPPPQLVQGKRSLLIFKRMKSKEFALTALVIALVAFLFSTLKSFY